MIENVDFEVKDGKTYIYRKIYDYDSLLIRLEPGIGKYSVDFENQPIEKRIEFKDCEEFNRMEDNVLVMDIMSYSFDGKSWFPYNEMRKIDKFRRDILNISPSNGYSI